MRNLSINKCESEANKVNEYIYAIWDVSGNFLTFEGNLKKLWLLNDKNKLNKIVFMGDVVADKYINSFDIIRKICDLRKEKSNISLIAGNHENSFLMFFSDGEMLQEFFDWDDNRIKRKIKKTIGFFELLRFSSKFYRYKPFLLKIDESLHKGSFREDFLDDEINFGIIKSIINDEFLNVSNRLKIIKNMQNDIDGELVLNELCQTKLFDLIDDNLFLHTCPTREIIDLLFEYSEIADSGHHWQYEKDILRWIDIVNKIWQEGLKKVLLGEGNGTDRERFKILQNIILEWGDWIKNSLNNDRNTVSSSDKEQYMALKNMWINNIIHGHNDGEEFGGVWDIWGVKIIDIDLQKKWNEHSWLKIDRTRGEIYRWKYNTPLYNVLDQRTFHMYDFDDNIAITEAGIHIIENKTWEKMKIPIKEFYSSYNHLTSKLGDKTFKFSRDYSFEVPNYFQDVNKRWDLILDNFSNQLLNSEAWPMMAMFEKDLIEGNIFAINTDRWHSRDAIKLGILNYIKSSRFRDKFEKMRKNLIKKYWSQWNLDNLLNMYLNECKFYNTSHSEFRKEFGDRKDVFREWGFENPKLLWMVNFLDYINDGFLSRDVEIIYSDDAIKNIEAMKLFLTSDLYKSYLKNWKYDDLKFVIRDTQDPDNIVDLEIC